jgi:photosystem II stability/assembly factor-like uncharacterized protein
VKALTVISLWIGLLVSGGTDVQAQRVRYWSLSENQLRIPNGGRANTIALFPGNPGRMFVASESGGLFYSADGGATWSHNDSLPVSSTQSVVYKPTNSNILYASAKADFKTGNGGGVWVGGTNGDVWRNANLNAPGPGDRLSGYEIAVQRPTGRVYAGTSEGVFESSDNGATWGYTDVFGGSDKSVYSVLATDTHVYYGGPRGVRVLNTTTGALTALSLGAVRNIHAFGTSPISGSPVFAVTASGLFVTRDNGTNWLPLSAPAAAGGCKGIPFIKAATGVTNNGITFFDLHYSNGCWLYKGVAAIGGTAQATASSWQAADLDHSDPRDLAIVQRIPKLLASNGGVHRTADDGHTWRLTGAGAGGFNALEIHEVKGQRIQHNLLSSTFDLYVGTQDNNLWAVNGDSGNLTSYPLGGHHIETDRIVPPGRDPKITFAVCPFSCVSRFSDRLFANVTLWPDAPRHLRTPVAIQDCQFVQGFRERRTTGIAVTEQCGTDWQTFATFPVETRDVPKVARSGFGDPLATTILYQAYKPNQIAPEWAFSGGLLLRADRQLFSSGEVEPTWPSMNGFGLIGVTPTMLPVFAVDPGNPDHVIAADVVTGVMQQTIHGGDDWEIIASLTNAVTEHDLQFAAPLNGPVVGRVFSLVTAVSFSPQDPSVVLAGTSEGGIYVSNDHGTSWTRIAGTERLPNVTSFAWANANRVYVSTFGRGLWRLDNRVVAAPADFNDLCGGTCEVVAMDGSSRPPFDQSVMVFDGSILGVRREEKQVREVFVTPGSSIVFTGDTKSGQDSIVITESDGKGEYESLPKGPDKWIAKGVVLTSDGGWAGTVFGDSIATLVPPLGKNMYSGPKQSPTAGKPYVTVTSDEFNELPTVAPNGTFELSGTDFVAGVTNEILIDGQSIKASATADGAGSFAINVVAPSEPGYHRVDVRAAKTETVLDSSVFVVQSDR